MNEPHPPSIAPGATPPPEPTAPPAPGRVRLDAEVLKACRRRLGLSQDALALACFERQLCVSIASVKRAETGKSLLLRTARHLAAFYDLDVTALMPGRRPPAGDEAWSQPDPSEPQALGAPRPDEGCVATPWPADSPASHETRLVLVLALWPVAPGRRAQLEAMLRAEGGQPWSDASLPGLALLGLFGAPRAQRSDLGRCLAAAERLQAWSQAEREPLHLALSAGLLAGDDLDWPEALLGDPAQPQAWAPGLHAHRSLFGPLRAHRELLPTTQPDIARLGDPVPQARRQFRLAGRQQELRQFQSLLDTVLADQQAQVLLVRGMAGMGKSRLLAECLDTAQQHFFHTVTVELQDFGGDRHREVFTCLLKALLDLGERGSFWEELVNQRLRPFALGPDSQLLARDLLGVAHRPEERALLQAMGHAQRAQWLVALFASLLTRSALRRPLLLAIEDLHWASAATIETLAQVMSACQEAQILWLLSSRVEEPLRLNELQRDIPEVAVTTLTLAPLRQTEGLDLARQFGHVDEAWRTQCIERAQGHPLFLTQLLMADRHEALPDTFQHLLQVRLDDVSPQDRHALRLAAVLGQPFLSSQLDGLMPSPGYDPSPLVQHCFLRHLDGGRHDFLHALIRQGIYEALPLRQREAMHLQVARQFQGVDAGLHARHLHLARQPEAPAQLLAAARLAHEAFDHEAALSLLQAYADVDYAPRDAHAHAMALGEVHSKMGRTPQAREAFERALVHAPDLAGRLSATVALAGALNVLDELQAEEALIDAALPEADQPGTQAQLAGLHYLKGNLYFPRGDVARSRHHHSLAMDVASRAGEARLQARALSGLGDSYYGEGRMPTAHGHFERCLALCEAHGLRDIEASNRFMLATTQIYLCQTADALQQALASAETGRRVGNRRAEIVSRLTASWIELSRGDAHAALMQAEEALLTARAIGAQRFEPFLQESQARALFTLGDADAARRTIEAAWEGVEQLGLHAFIGPWVLGTLALLSADEGRALQALDQGQALMDKGCVAHNVYRFHASAMECHVLAGRHDQALAVGAQWRQRTGQEPTPWVAGLADFMAACATHPAEPPGPGHPSWQALRSQQTLHVMLRLPRALLP